MKILFFAKGQETLAIEYLSASLKNAGHEVELLFEPELDGGMGFLPPYLLKWLRNEKLWIEAIEKISPDLVALSCPLNIYPFVKQVVKLVKQYFDIPVIVGGGHATLAPDYLLANGNIDMVCLGEGEEPLVELADKMASGKDFTDTKNIWFKKNGTIIRNPVRSLLEEIDCLPFPDRDLFYKYGCFSGNVYFVAGRGCPYHCTYCCQHSFQKIYRGKGKYVRFRSVENVIKELEICMQKYDVKHIHSEDDTFTADRKWLFDFFDEYEKKIKAPFYCHVRPGTLSQELLQRMKKSGCEAVFFGIDSGNATYRKTVLRRNITNEVMYEQAELVKKSGIKLATASMFGMPGETAEQMMETFNMALSVRSDFAYDSIFYPFYGTELYDYAVSNGFLTKKSIAMIKEGLGSPYQYSLLKNPHNRLAMVLKNCLPSYVKFPRLRPLHRVVIKKKWLRMSSIINLSLTPFSYAYMGRLKRKEIRRTLVKYLWFKFFSPKGLLNIIKGSV